MNKHNLIGGLVLGLCVAAGVRAEVLIRESFDYQDGSLVEVSGGRWQHHSGTRNELQVSQGCVCLSQEHGEDVNILLCEQPISTNEVAPLFASFDLRIAAIPEGSHGAYFLHFKDAATGFRGRVFLAASETEEGGCHLGVASGASTPNVFHPSTLLLHSNYQVVVTYVPAQGATRLWINASSESDPSVVSTDEATLISVSGLALRQSLSGGNGMGIIYLDNLTVGTQFSDVCQATSPVPQSPSIVSAPADQTVVEGGMAEFRVVVFGTAPICYQWYHGQEPLSGATNAVIQLAAVNQSSAGDYYVVASNSVGTVQSQTAHLDVTGAMPKAPLIEFTNIVENAFEPGAGSTNTFIELALRSGEKLTIHVSIDAQDEHEFSLVIPTESLPPAAVWETAELEGIHLEARFIYEAQSQDAGRQYEVRLAANNGEASSEIAVSIYVLAASEQSLAITEFLANPSSDPASVLYNPLHRPLPAAHPAIDDEFIELVNVAQADLDLAGWSLSDAQQVRHVFPAGCVLGANQVCVVYGGGSDETTPDLGVMIAAASETSSGLSLNNSGDESIVIRNANHCLISRIDYRGEQLSVAGSLCRAPNLDGEFVDHSTVSPLPASPGRRSDGSSFQEHSAVVENIGPIHILHTPSGGVRLEWQAVAGARYTVWGTPRLDNGFQTITNGLQFIDQNGFYETSSPAPFLSQFLMVSSP